MAKRRLNRKQIEHIKKSQQRRRERAAARNNQANQNESLSGVEQSGLLIANYGANLIVEAPSGQMYQCTTRQHLGTLVCGDQVIWQSITEGDDKGVIVALEPRKTLLTRNDVSGRLKPVAANIDQVVIIIAPKPPLNEFLIDRYLLTIESIGVKAILLLNKVDLLSETDLDVMKQRLSCFTDIGYQLIFASNKTEQGLEKLRQQLSSHTSILVGQSGVGKSSLTKSLIPDKEIRIQSLSEATGLGIHTTTTSMLYHLLLTEYEDASNSDSKIGDLIDSPGVRSFEPSQLSLAQLEQGFIEFAAYLGHCRFSNCSHTVEPNCALLEAVAEGEIDPRRLQSYLQLRESCQD